MLRVVRNQGDALVAERRHLLVVGPVDRPEGLVFRLREAHHLGHDRDLLRPHVGSEQLRVRREVQGFRLLLGRRRRLGLAVRRRGGRKENRARRE
jgi:hypothetical protein